MRTALAPALGRDYVPFCDMGLEGQLCFLQSLCFALYLPQGSECVSFLVRVVLDREHFPFERIGECDIVHRVAGEACRILNDLTTSSEKGAELVRAAYAEQTPPKDQALAA